MKAALFILFIAFSLQSWSQSRSVERTRSLAQLIREYNSLPTPENERLIEDLMNNSMFQNVLPKSSEDLLNRMDQLNFDPIQIGILKKQKLLAEMFQQAVLEIQDPKELEKFLLSGEGQGLKVPSSVQRMSSFKVIFDLLSLLLQREDAVKIIALKILKLEGPVHPSTGAFNRGLADYAALHVGDVPMFSLILKLMDSLNAVIAKYPKSLEGKSESYFLTSISHELDLPNDAIELKKMSQTIFEQIQKRTSDNKVRGDLITILIRINNRNNQPEIERFIEDILQNSESTSEILGTLDGLASRKNLKTYKMIYNSINRIQNLPESQKLLRMAIHYFTVPFEKSTEIASELSPLLLNLYQHANPEVRKFSVNSLKWSGFTKTSRDNYLLNFLNDPDERVREAAMAHFSLEGEDDSKSARRIKELAKSEPNKNLRAYATTIATNIPDEPAIENTCTKFFGGH